MNHFFSISQLYSAALELILTARNAGPVKAAFPAELDQTGRRNIYSQFAGTYIYNFDEIAQLPPVNSGVLRAVMRQMARSIVATNSGYYSVQLDLSAPSFLESFNTLSFQREDEWGRTGVTPRDTTRVFFYANAVNLVKSDRLLANVKRARPDLIITDLRNRGARELVADYTLNPDFYTASEMRFIAETNYSSPRQASIGFTTDIASRPELYIGVKPDGTFFRVTSGEADRWQPIWADYIESVESIRATLVDARRIYRNRVMAGFNRRAEEQERAESREKQLRRDKAANAFAKYRDAIERGRVAPTEMVIPTLPMVPSGTKSSRRWGIEIETGAGRDLSGVPDEWDSKGDGSLESAYAETYVHPSDCEQGNHDDTIYQVNPETGRGEYVDNPDYVPSWDCDYCGDRDYDYDDDDCVELVSPILSSAHSRGLKQITNDLEHAPRTDTAGVHVHVEAKDLTVMQVRNLVLGYDHIESIIESSYDRKDRGYCKRRATNELLAIARHAKDNPTMTLRNLETGDRYVSVNLQSIRAHGTIEFRAMGPRYNYDHLVRWAMFCREMVNVAKAGATAKEWSKVKDWNGVLAMFAKYGVEYNQAVTSDMEGSFSEVLETSAV